MNFLVHSQFPCLLGKTGFLSSGLSSSAYLHWVLLKNEHFLMHFLFFRSVLVLNGNGADVAKHCVPAVPMKRYELKF